MRCKLLTIYISLILTVCLICINAQQLFEERVISFHDPCEPNLCGRNAVCRNNGDNIVSCICPAGYEGNPLDHCVSQELCEPNPCGLNAKCRARGKFIACTCPIGYEGDPFERCLLKNPNEPNQCGQNAINTCVCQTGYAGNPFKTCFKRNPCELMPCGINAECHAQGENRICACPNGYVGNPLSKCTLVDSFEPNPCGNETECHPRGENHTCGYNICGINADCYAQGQGKINICTCRRGYKGNAMTGCIPISPCLPNTCGTNAQCDARLETAICTCPTGYVGNPLINCTLHDPCEPNPCGINADCNVNGIDFNCTCPNKYNGNPHIECTCPNGYEGDTHSECIHGSVNSELNLWNAAKNGNISIVIIELTRGADPNWSNLEHGAKTALHMATESNQAAIVELLLNAGADFKRKDFNGNTAIQLARELGNMKEVINIFTAYDADVYTRYS